MRVLIVGCGYVGVHLGLRLVRAGHEVFGLRRSVPSASEIRVAGIQPLQADITRPESLSGLPRDFDWVVNCAASGGGTPEDYRRLYVTGNTNLVAWLATAPPRKFVYTSSTSVYGQNHGELVTEADVVLPEAETARVLVEAEQGLLNRHEAHGFPAVILRVAGIYGPGRGHWLKQFLRGEARLAGKGARFVNMIHLEDVAGAIQAALERAPAGRVFNAVDHEPVSQRDCFAWLAAHLGKPMPPSVPVEPDATGKRGSTNKRVSGDLLRRELNYEFRYPTFREGCRAEIERMRAAGESEQSS